MSRVRATRAGFGVVLALAVSYPHTPLAELVDGKILDALFRLATRNSTSGVAPEVVVVGIDEASFRVFREPLALWHPHIAKLLEALAAAGPRMVVLDVVLPDRSYDFLKSGSDRELLRGLLEIKKVAPIVIAQTVDEHGRLRPLFPPIISIVGVEALGLALVKVDPDGTVRRFHPAVQAEGGPSIKSLIGQAALALESEVGEGFIDFSLGEPFGYVPIQDVLQWLDDGDQKALEDSFGGRVVVLGSVLPLSDRHDAPIALAAWEQGNRRLPGVLIHAQALRTVVGSALIQRAPHAWVLGSVVLATLLWWVGSRPLWGVGLLIAGCTAGWAMARMLLPGGIFLPVSGMAFAGGLALVGRATLDSFYVARERHLLRNSFGRYVSPPVLEDIVEGRLQPGVGGSRRQVCVLFSDIRGFTGRSERETPEAVIGLLNRYFNEMTEVVHRQGGTVDKFIGDGLMAFFGAPNERPNPAVDGFSAACGMIARLDALNRELEAERIEPIAIGVGLHLGEVVVGHVGSDTRHEYTAIGDAVNVASRLESLTKQVGYPVVCSEEIKNALDGESLDELGPQAIKGHTPVMVYGWRPTWSDGPRRERRAQTSEPG